MTMAGKFTPAGPTSKKTVGSLGSCDSQRAGDRRIDGHHHHQDPLSRSMIIRRGREDDLEEGPHPQGPPIGINLETAYKIEEAEYAHRLKELHERKRAVAIREAALEDWRVTELAKRSKVMLKETIQQQDATLKELERSVAELNEMEEAWKVTEPKYAAEEQHLLQKRRELTDRETESKSWFEEHAKSQSTAEEGIKTMEQALRELETTLQTRANKIENMSETKKNLLKSLEKIQSENKEKAEAVEERFRRLEIRKKVNTAAWNQSEAEVNRITVERNALHEKRVTSKSVYDKRVADVLLATRKEAERRKESLRLTLADVLKAGLIMEKLTLTKLPGCGDGPRKHSNAVYNPRQKM